MIKVDFSIFPFDFFCAQGILSISLKCHLIFSLFFWNGEMFSLEKETWQEYISNRETICRRTLMFALLQLPPTL